MICPTCHGRRLMWDHYGAIEFTYSAGSAQPDPPKALPKPPPWSPGEGFNYRQIAMAVYAATGGKPEEFDRFVEFVKTNTDEN